MASERRLRIKTLAMVLAMVVCANAGDLMLKRGMSEIGAVQLTASGLSEAFRLTVTNGTIWVGIFFLTGFMVSYMTVLSWRTIAMSCPRGHLDMLYSRCWRLFFCTSRCPRGAGWVLS